MHIQGILKTQFSCVIGQLSYTEFEGSELFGDVYITVRSGTLPLYADMEAAEPAFIQWLAARKTEREVADRREEAKITRDEHVISNLTVELGTFQVDVYSRDKMRDAIDYSTRNSRTLERRNWILADNTVASVRTADMQAVLDAYIERLDSTYLSYGIWASGDMSTSYTV